MQSLVQGHGLRATFSSPSPHGNPGRQQSLVSCTGLGVDGTRPAASGSCGRLGVGLRRGKSPSQGGCLGGGRGTKQPGLEQLGVSSSLPSVSVSLPLSPDPTPALGLGVAGFWASSVPVKGSRGKHPKQTNEAAWPS